MAGPSNRQKIATVVVIATMVAAVLASLVWVRSLRQTRAAADIKTALLESGNRPEDALQRVMALPDAEREAVVAEYARGSASRSWDPRLKRLLVVQDAAFDPLRLRYEDRPPRAGEIAQSKVTIFDLTRNCPSWIKESDIIHGVTVHGVAEDNGLVTMRFSVAPAVAARAGLDPTKLMIASLPSGEFDQVISMSFPPFSRLTNREAERLLFLLRTAGESIDDSTLDGAMDID